MKKSWFKTTDALVAATIIPILIMIIIFVQREIFPFGDKSFLRTDLYHQYAPFFSEFKYKLDNGGSLAYTWNVGLGVNFTALFAYYLASPLNWIIYLVPARYTIEFITYMMVLKVGLAGFTMTYYCLKHNENSVFSAAFFGIFYALSGYIAAYSWNVMWMDCIALFPLVCLGVDKLVNSRKCMLYVVTLAFCILSNYYISIMICIFMVIYFIMQMILREKKPFKDTAAAICHFGFYSLLAGALAAIILAPEAYALMVSASGSSTFPKTFTQYFSIIDMLARHMINVSTEQGLDHWPNIYCGVAVFPLIALYFMNRKISLKEKIVYGFVCVFMLAGFSINFMNFIWHGYHFPNSLPARQSFIYIFLVLFMGFKALDNIDGNTLKDLGIATGISLGFVLLCQKVVTDDAFTYVVFYVTLIGVAVYALLIYLFKTGRANVNMLTFITLAIVSVEAAVNMTTTSITTITRSTYLADNADVRAVVSSAETKNPGFYRYEKVNRKSKDDGAQMNFKSVSVFSSTVPKALSDFFREVGCEASVNSYSITGSTPLVDAMLDVKYSINTGTTEDTSKTLRYTSGDINLYENKYCLPLGYVLSNDLIDNWTLDMGNPALVQNDLCSLLEANDVLIRKDGFHEGNYYSITIPEDGLYYAFAADPAIDTLDVDRGEIHKTYDNLKRGFFVELGICRKNEIIDFRSKDSSNPDVQVYRFDYDALSDVTTKLGRSSMNVTKYDDTHITANITTDKAGVLFMSIPYDKGWTVYVDGQPRTARKIFDSFMGVDVSEGYHDIIMNYEPEGLRMGSLISAGALSAFIILLAITIVVNTRRKNNKSSRYNSETDNNKAEEINSAKGKNTAEEINSVKGIVAEINTIKKPETEIDIATKPSADTEIIVGTADEGKQETENTEE